jgi:hypothetical protein
MIEKTSKQWWGEYCDWGGKSCISDATGWDPRDRRKSWHRESITAEEFLRRIRNSEMVYEKNLWDISDIEYYFTLVVREGD